MNDLESRDSQHVPERFTAYNRTLGIVVSRIDELRAIVAAKAEPSEADVAWGYTGENATYGFLNLEGVKTPVSLEFMGDVVADVKYVIKMDNPEAPQGDVGVPHVLAAVFEFHKDGLPFAHSSDMNDVEIKERLDDSHEEAYRVKADIQANEYQLLVSPELPPMLVQSCMLYEDPWLDAEVIQSANKHILSDHDVSQLLGVIDSAQAWYEGMDE